MQNLKIAVVQMRSTDDPWENLFQAHAFVEEAQRAKCDLVCFPENVFYRGPKESRSAAFLSLDDRGHLRLRSDFSTTLSVCAAEWPITVSLGSVIDTTESESMPFNSHWWLAPGQPIQSYRKMHLFDFTGAHAAYRESQDVQPGNEPKTARVAGCEVGLTICYDLRFPELYRHLTLQRRTELLLVPSAFTRETGEAHWQTLLRARAIENLSFVAAAAQWGSHRNSKGQELFCYGHSAIYGPWGETLAEAPGEGDALLVADLSAAALDGARSRLPSLTGARLIV